MSCMGQIGLLGRLKKGAFLVPFSHSTLDLAGVKARLKSGPDLQNLTHKNIACKCFPGAVQEQCE